MNVIPLIPSLLTSSLLAVQLLLLPSFLAIMSFLPSTSSRILPVVTSLSMFSKFETKLAFMSWLDLRIWERRWLRGVEGIVDEGGPKMEGEVEEGGGTHETLWQGVGCVQSQNGGARMGCGIKEC